MQQITVKARIAAPLERVWEYWTDPEHIKGWNFATPDWHCPEAANELVPGGSFHYAMSARDGSFSFDFCGRFTHIEPQSSIHSLLEDGRKTEVVFEYLDGHTLVTETFEPEDMNPPELQQAGWQSILDNFKRYAEALPA
jgi:uncharacterized protein YndB with AHSA1/START domain